MDDLEDLLPIPVLISIIGAVAAVAAIVGVGIVCGLLAFLFGILPDISGAAEQGSLLLPLFLA